MFSSGASDEAATASGSGIGTTREPPRALTSAVCASSWSAVSSAKRSTAAAWSPCAHDATFCVATTTASTASAGRSNTVSTQSVDRTTASSAGCVSRTSVMLGIPVSMH